MAGSAASPQYATGGGDDKAFLWSVRARLARVACFRVCVPLRSVSQLNEHGGAQAVELVGHRDSVAAVAFRWGLSPLVRFVPVRRFSAVLACYSVDGSVLATGSLDGRVHIWRVLLL